MKREMENTSEKPPRTAQVQKEQRRRHGVWWKIGYGLWLTFNLIVAAGLFAASYAGELDPATKPWACIVIMTMPGWYFASITVAVLDLIWWRRTLVVPLLAIIGCLQPMWNYCPLNLPPGKLTLPQQERSFKLMSYNVFGLQNIGPDTVPIAPNRTLQYILEQNADIVCLQELAAVGVSEKLGVTAEQVDSLHSLYPYVIVSNNFQSLLSKYPVTPLQIDNHDFDGSFAAYHIEVHGHLLTVFNCHFQSFQLSSNVKEDYVEFTEGLTKPKSAEQLWSVLIDKLITAYRLRAVQADMIGRLVKHYGGENVIVCGDFNDVPGCYTLRRLADFGLKEVYPQVGFGPKITYYDDRFYFRIDHQLYRGDFKPHSIVRGKVKSSDHYPLTTTFVFNER